MENYIFNLTGRTFIKSVAIENNKVTVFFYSSFEEFIQANECTKIDEKDYNEYFSEDKAEKILAGEPARILREFPFIDRVSIVLTLNKLVYEVDVDRKRLDAFLGFEVSKLSTMNESWVTEFADVYIYNKNNRKKLLKVFAVVR